MSYATRRANLKDIILSEIKQSQDNNAWIHLQEASNVAKLIEKGSRMVVAKGWEEGRGGVAIQWV